MAYQLGAYEPEQREDYLRLLQEAWGDFALTGPEFDWWFRDNPTGSLMSVAREHGSVVGVAAHSLSSSSGETPSSSSRAANSSGSGCTSYPRTAAQNSASASGFSHANVMLPIRATRLD